MRDDNYPHPVGDPEARGLPQVADDDSTAYDDVESGRAADGPDPAALPADQPLGIDHFGTTAEEERLGESLDYKLDREVPDETDLDPLTGLDTVPVVPNLGSPVSMYDTGIGGRGAVVGAGGLVGRLVEPDEGVREDTESDAIAYDAGAAGGGATAEELAMHEVPEP